MMRRNIGICSLLGGMLFLCAACSSDESVSGTDAQTIRFAASSVTQTGVGSRSVINGSDLPVNDAVGVFTYSYDSSSSWSLGDAGNTTIYDNEAGTIGTPDNNRQPITLSNSQFYTSARKHAFFSYYPYQNTLTTVDHVVDADLFTSLLADTTQIDWLRAEPVLDVVASPNPVALTYSHVMTMVRIAVAKTAGVGAELNLQRVTLGTSTSQKFTFDVISGTVTHMPDGATKYEELLATPVEVPELASTPGALATEIASEILLLPGSAVTSLSFRVNDEEFSTPGDWAGFTTSATGGKFRLVSIVFGVSEITIQLGGQDWVDGEETDLTQSEITISLGAKGWDYDPATDIDMTQSTITISLGAKGWVDHGTSIPTKK